jgi:hypothetical protein
MNNLYNININNESYLTKSDTLTVQFTIIQLLEGIFHIIANSEFNNTIYKRAGQTIL